MKTKISKLTYLFFIMVVAGFVSCTGDTGPIGPVGPDGTNGTNGTDGNANVQTYVYNTPSWNTSGFGMLIDMASILTDNILENDVILVYVKHTGLDMIASIPGDVWVGSYRSYGVFIGNSTSINPGAFILTIVSHEMDGTGTPNANLASVDWVKVIIIESTNTTTATGNGKSMSTKNAVYDELNNAGVDINNYYELMDYYGLDY